MLIYASILLKCNIKQILATNHDLLNFEIYSRASKDEKAQKIVPQTFYTECIEKEGVFLLAMEYLEPSDMLVMDTIGSAPWTQEMRLQVTHSQNHTSHTVGE